MNTTVRRGAGRPAATRKRNRHSQTTALPPKAAKSAAPDPAAETPVEAREQYGLMTIPELKARAGQLHVKPVPRTKGALLNAILEAERNVKHLAAVAAAVEEPQEPGWDGAAPSDAIEQRGARKAEKLAAEITPHGWSTPEVTALAAGRVTAVSRRGAEVLTVVWDSGVFDYELSGHIIQDRTTKIRNVSHGRQLAARPAAEAAAELARVSSNRSFRPREPRTSTPKGKMPFDPETSSDAEVIAALLGRHVVWVNRISNLEEHAQASKTDRQWKVTGEGAERVIQFTTETGYRAARLDMILRVGKPTRKRAVASGDESAEAEAA